jgi:hypothetical protein
VWPVVIVVISPFFDDIAGMIVAGKQVFIQTLIAQPTVEAFNKTVLHWFARRNIMPFDLGVLLPFQHSV